MHGFLWFLQVVLALLFAATGVLKLIRPRDHLRELMPWTADAPLPRVRLIGVLELAAAVGLVLPGLTGILPWLTPLAATGLAVLMALASLTHYRRGEDSMILITVPLGVVAAVVAVFRFGPYAW